MVKLGLEVVFPLFADKLQHLGGAALLVAGTVLEVFLGKVAVFVQRFAAGQLDLLPGAGGQRHLHIAGDILPKVQHRSRRWAFAAACRGRLRVPESARYSYR